MRPKFPLFSLGSRTKILNKSLTIEALNDNPGPGSYENIEMASKSSTPLSGYVKLSYSPSRSKRFPNYGILILTQRIAYQARQPMKKWPVFPVLASSQCRNTHARWLQNSPSEKESPNSIRQPKKVERPQEQAHTELLPNSVTTTRNCPTKSSTGWSSHLSSPKNKSGQAKGE